jgi:uncharacterized damage-inducible protein DinB
MLFIKSKKIKMKALLQQYAAYNIWANKTLLERISQMDEENINTTVVSSFPSVYKTALHLWQAENIWWQRMHGVENIAILSESFKGSFAELRSGFYNQSQQWAEWVAGISDDELNRSFSFTRNNQQYNIIVKDMLLHIFNHATFHRGQLVTLLRQLGQTENIPSTDFSTFCRLKNS